MLSISFLVLGLRFFTMQDQVQKKCRLMNETASKMIVMVHSGAALKKERDMYRQVCFPLYKDIPHFFVSGIPSFDDRKADQKVQGQIATEKEIRVSFTLLEEQRRYGDILVTPNRDYYRDKTEKLLGVLRYGVEYGAEYILKLDDDTCLNVTAAKHVIEKHERDHPDSELYAGAKYYMGTEGNNMKGPNGEVTRFMDGPSILLSRNLAETIVGPDWMHNVLKAVYGTSSDDANLGRMVVRAKDVHNISLNIVEDKKLLLCDLKAKLLEENLRDCYIESR